MKKWKSLLAVLALTAILFGVRVSIAYFTDRDKQDNVFTVGKVDIALSEPAWDPADDHVIAPGAVYEKDPTVTNTGNNDAYVRVHFRISDYEAFRAFAPSDYDPTTMFDLADDAWKLSGEPQVTAEGICYTYAHPGILAAGEATKPVFSSVTMPAFADTEFAQAAGGEFDVTVWADAIQSDGFTDYREAFAAFDQQMSS